MGSLHAQRCEWGCPKILCVNVNMPTKTSESSKKKVRNRSWGLSTWSIFTVKKTYQHRRLCCRLSACPLSASPCWCHRPRPWIPGARPLWSNCWKCPATTASAWTAPPAASAALAENERTPGNGRQCHLQGRIITKRGKCHTSWGFRLRFTCAHRTALPVPPATSRSRTPGWGCMACSSTSFHNRWIPRLMASFITSYFCATFSNTLYTEKAKRKRRHLSHWKPLTVYVYSVICTVFEHTRIFYCTHVLICNIL